MKAWPFFLLGLASVVAVAVGAIMQKKKAKALDVLDLGLEDDA